MKSISKLLALSLLIGIGASQSVQASLAFSDFMMEAGAIIFKGEFMLGNFLLKNHL